MTKKHFEAIAENLDYKASAIFNGEETYQEKWFALAILQGFVYDLAITFKGFNENFDMSRFIQSTNITKYKLELEREQATKIASGI